MAISDTQHTSTLANLFAIFLDCTTKFFQIPQDFRGRRHVGGNVN
jgi:hypothetical protein